MSMEVLCNDVLLNMGTCLSHGSLILFRSTCRRFYYVYSTVKFNSYLMYDYMFEIGRMSETCWKYMCLALGYPSYITAFSVSTDDCYERSNWLIRLSGKAVTYNCLNIIDNICTGETRGVNANVQSIAICHSNIAVLEILHAKDLLDRNSIYFTAIFYKRVEVLEWIYINDCSDYGISSVTIGGALRTGDIPMIEWFISRSPNTWWIYNSYPIAAWYGYIHVLNWLYLHGYPLSRRIPECSNRETIAWFHQHLQ